jgi:hypothetical protein
MVRSTLFLFGASEKGELCRPHHFTSLQELLDVLGHPPEHSEGIPCAIQALLFQHTLIFFKVSEEGFSRDDYIHGLKLLRKKEIKRPVDAICMPGVGDEEIIQATTPICYMYQSVLIVSQKDLYDYLTVK